MQGRDVLTVDLGSSYTKIGRREGWNANAILVRDLPLAPRDVTFCIPSVVAHIERPKGERWLIGVEAASQLRGPGVTIYENWKRGLFSAAASAADQKESARVAVQFFLTLREHLPEDLAELPIRVCIPKLGNGDETQRLLTNILCDAGWQVATKRPTVFEPEANALGILSRGRNRTWRPRYLDFTGGPERAPYLPSMLEPSLSSVLRRATLREKFEYYGVLVTDIGAFTTDFGYARFEPSFFSDDWNQPPISQRSSELGIRELDDEVLQRLDSASREAVQSAPSGEWDRLKTQLYKGESIAFAGPKGGTVIIGEGKAARTIKGTVAGFADRVWQTRQEFSMSLKDSIHAEVLTGGGAMIPLIRQNLMKRMKTEGVNMIYDLFDKDEPRRALADGDADVDERAVEERARENIELVRGGCAVGGCSVFFE
ncbi:MAG: hypothetical protein WD773_07645 [Gemmatimonadales bacterium]